MKEGNLKRSEKKFEFLFYLLVGIYWRRRKHGGLVTKRWVSKRVRAVDCVWGGRWKMKESTNEGILGDSSRRYGCRWLPHLVQLLRAVTGTKPSFSACSYGSSFLCKSRHARTQIGIAIWFGNLQLRGQIGQFRYIWSGPP